MSIGGYNTNLHIKNEKTNIVDYYDTDGQYVVKIFAIKINGMDLGFT